LKKLLLKAIKLIIKNTFFEGNLSKSDEINHLLRKEGKIFKIFVDLFLKIC
jgi:hypothetical protein